MHFNHLRPMLWTEQLDETITFYTQTLGFTSGERNDEWGWASLHRDGVDIMLAKPNTHTAFEKPQFTGSFYINIDDVEGLWAELKDKATIVYDMDTFEWGMKEFAIFDNNGYILQFGQDVGDG